METSWRHFTDLSRVHCLAHAAQLSRLCLARPDMPSSSYHLTCNGLGTLPYFAALAVFVLTATPDVFGGQGPANTQAELFVPLKIAAKKKKSAS